MMLGWLKDIAGVEEAPHSFIVYYRAYVRNTIKYTYEYETHIIYNGSSISPTYYQLHVCLENLI